MPIKDRFPVILDIDGELTDEQQQHVFERWPEPMAANGQMHLRQAGQLPLAHHRRWPALLPFGQAKKVGHLVSVSVHLEVSPWGVLRVPQVLEAQQRILYAFEEDVHVSTIGSEVHVRAIPAAEVLNVQVEAPHSIDLDGDTLASAVRSQRCNSDAIADVQGRETRGVLTENSPRKVCQRVGELSRLAIERSFLSSHR
ncbi:hypothetical protein [Streptomyces tirandamycinicus]|uniref:hypothetical protein n=1 Tax=Streptomyces tirandamycinicus TaxID=2174846 RepID=UPI001ABF1DC3|nr:hypothetical protein [Streptomyces tirandamycinicus]